jgi:hypothetical protein
MNRKIASWALIVVAVAGIGWLHIVAWLDDPPWIVAFFEHAAWEACFMTVLAIGVVLGLAPADRRAAPPVIVATLLLDIVLLAVVLGEAAMWTVPAVVVGAILAGSAGFLATGSQRQRLALRILAVVGVSTVLFLAAYAIVIVDMPWF